MKKIFLYSSLLLLMVAGFYACDSTTAPEDKFSDSPAITYFNVSPKEINFSAEEHGFADTTISITVEARFKNLNDANVLAVLSAKDVSENIAEEFMEFIESQTNTYGVTFEVETTTTSFQQYFVNIIFPEETKVYAQSNITVSGFPNNPPQILEANNPEEVQIPSGNEVVNFLFTAKVIDPEGQNNIDRVLIEFVNEDGSRLVPSPNDLLDDGRSGLSGSGDLVAGDSVYSKGFSINSSNTPNNRTVEYFAIDKAGLSSDTVKTQFNIVE